VDEIRAQARETAFWTGRDHFDERVLSAIARVPRHAFIPEPLTLNQAYANHPQPIGFGQTISQPYIVALMTDLLNLQGGERVLEIGAGCGYQSAVLAQLGCEVYAVERLEPLADLARATLAKLGFERVTVKCADGAKGWAEHAPFDGILVTEGAHGYSAGAKVGAADVAFRTKRRGWTIHSRTHLAGIICSTGIAPGKRLKLCSCKLILPATVH